VTTKILLITGAAVFAIFLLLATVWAAVVMAYEVMAIVLPD
jgi:hypothetical protein